MAGIAVLVFEMGFLYFLTEIVGLHYLISSSISFVIALLANYAACRLWVFKGELSPKPFYSLALFVAASIMALCINQICLFFLAEIVGLYYMEGKLLSAIVVAVWNYATKRYSMTCSR